MLKTFTSHASTPDVALELPTGTGKTLTGLLIAEWTRRSRRERVIYACPTQQLARQVVAAAYREGIDVALLIGNHEEWPVAEHTAYEAAEAIAVTTYSSVFNTNPHLADADLILFDDAHAGEQYVGEAYGVDLGRWKAPDQYRSVLDTIAPALDGVFHERLQNTQSDPGIKNDVRLVVPLRQQGMVSSLNSVLSALPKPYSYRYSMIQAGLASCLIYVAYSGILIRPYLPPTHQNRLFSGARQRVYLSATLGEGGELERAFGRAGIVRLEQPDESTSPRYGRRFFVFPEFVEEGDPVELSRAVVAEAGKALVLATRKDTAITDATELAQTGWPIWGVDKVTDGMDAFAALDNGVCGLAARYDGLDLPGNACRLVALDGVPDQDNLQERFLQSRARAGAALSARIRTRVVQGAGRCTRGPGDIAIVLVLDAGLSRFLTRPEVVSALDSELQAELRFGRENSQSALPSDVLENVQAFLHQDADDSWRTQAEPALTEYRRHMSRQTPEGVPALSACVAEEIQAWGAATIGAWGEAAQHAHEVARLAGEGGPSTVGYRAFWIYLEAAWTDQAAEETNSSAGHATAQALVRLAQQVMGIGSWVRQMAPFAAMERSGLNSVDAIAVNAVATELDAGVNQGKMRGRFSEILAGLKQRDPGQYEPALTELGGLVGAKASKPLGKGRCDSTWCWDNELWLALEAKSNHKPTGVVSHRDIRQANDQLRLLVSDRRVSAPPPDSATIVISPKPGIDDDGIRSAEAHVHMIPPSAMSEIALDVTTAWGELLPKSGDLSLPDLRELVADVFQARGVLPTQIHERVTTDPVGSTRR